MNWCFRHGPCLSDREYDPAAVMVAMTADAINERQVGVKIPHQKARMNRSGTPDNGHSKVRLPDRFGIQGQKTTTS